MKIFMGTTRTSDSFENIKILIRITQCEVGNRAEIFLTIYIRILSQQGYIICLLFVIGTIVFYAILP